MNDQDERIGQMTTRMSNSEDWEQLKEDTKGLLEKLASAKTLSFRSYQLCVWQVQDRRGPRCRQTPLTAIS